MNIVIYRIHYGFQFIYESIKSVYNWADEIIVVVSREPWYKEKYIKYLNEDVKLVHPENMEYHINNLSHIPKVRVNIEEFNTPKNQWGILINRYSNDYVLTMEPDMIFTDVNILNTLLQDSPIIFVNQLEYWRNEYWRIPQRTRAGPVLYKNPNNIITGFSNVANNIPTTKSSTITLNYGFCFNPEIMLYKHLLALGFSKQIGDSIPSETWYRDKWLNWTPQTKNLEISAKYITAIPRAILV